MKEIKYLFKLSLLIAIILSTELSVKADNRNSKFMSWHRIYTDSLQGTHSDDALNYLMQNTNISPRDIIVAILDTGIDYESSELESSLWCNPEEVLDGKDNDNNGYIDDLHGWNFLGSGDGTVELLSVGTEEYRQFKTLHLKYKDYPTDSQDAGYLYYRKMRKLARIDKYFKLNAFEKRKELSYYRIDSILKTISTIDLAQFSIGKFMNLSLPQENKLLEKESELIVSDIMRVDTATLWTDFKLKHKNKYELIKNRIQSIETSIDKRTLLGDDMTNGRDLAYGNNKINGQGLEHGTFVASVIVGKGSINKNVCGVYQQAKLMTLRVVPDRGDEYDKDISSAIYYAVDNGAKVINLSLGKYTSPQADLIEKAFEYAFKKDVVIVHSSGNDGKDLDKTDYYPSGLDSQGKVYPNYIRVGASDELGARAKFSNFGKSVDVYASGVKIWGMMTDKKVESSQGTSISAPIVSSVIAMLRAYFPKLTASEIKNILIQTSRPLSNTSLQRAGCIDALAAVKEAERVSNQTIGLNWAKVEQSSEAHIRPIIKDYFIFPHWLDNGEYFYYSTLDENKHLAYYLVRSKDGLKKPLLSSKDDFVKQYEELSGKKLDANNLRLYGLRFDQNNIDYFYWKKSGKSYVYNRKSGRLSLNNEQKSKEHNEVISDDTSNKENTNYKILTQGYNLMLKDSRTGSTKQITFDGKENASYAIRYDDKLKEHNARGSWWGDKYIAIIKDDSEVGDMTIINWLSKRPKAKTFKMPLAGDKGVRKTLIFCFDLKTMKGSIIKEENINTDLIKEEQKIYYSRRSRYGEKIELCLIDLNKGFEVKTLISEEVKPHINLTLFNYHLINKGENIVWWSERTGKGNYYLYNKEGQFIRRLTKGNDLVAGSILSFDEQKQTMIFSGYGQEEGHNPYYKHYYEVDMKGNGQQHLLTPENANHELELSPDKRFFVDKYSRMDLPPHWKIGQISKYVKAKVFAEVDLKTLIEAGWQAPQIIKLKAKDNKTDLYGVLYLPYNLDKTKHYPLITNVYPGPQTDLVPRSFSIDDNGNQSLANMGCIVMNIASRGSSPLRGKEFYCYSYGNFRDYPLDDDKHCIEQVAKLYPYVDLDRIGIYGHSGGAFQAVTAMCQYPDFYKVGFAASGNHDNNIYINWWGEVFHGSTPIPTNLPLVNKLKGKLMIAVGDMDNNVPMGSTVRLANALIKAGKPFNFFLFPNKQHDLDSPYYQNLIRYYFARNLLNIELNDTNIINHK